MTMRYDSIYFAVTKRQKMLKTVCSCWELKKIKKTGLTNESQYDKVLNADAIKRSVSTEKKLDN